MALTINNNLMAANVARNLSESYGKLGRSTQRLSSGLRVNSAADDAAGLAIRELMRAEISSMNQGIRNANDAISMVQTADGALQVIDEKLIRMKELATQAATGTYNSDQRLIIDSEYQAMASEITRIANATKFNGTYLLNGNLEAALHDGSGIESTGKMKIHFGPSNNSAEDYYYITISGMTGQHLSVGNMATVFASIDLYRDNLSVELDSIFGSNITDTQKNNLLNATREALQFFATPIPNDVPGQAKFDEIIDRYGPNITWEEYQGYNEQQRDNMHYIWTRDAVDDLMRNGYNTFTAAPAITVNVTDSSNPPATRAYNVEIEGILNTPALRNNFNQALSNSGSWYLARHNYDGNNIKTQENAQRALDAINRAILHKDNTRADLGALQNRLANTITNLSIQAENLLAAESRISDADVALEMTNFVRNQIVTQAAVAMLAQANALPRMAMQLISG